MEGINSRRGHLGEQRKLRKHKGFIERIQGGRVWSG